MRTIENRPVSKLLIGSAASFVMAGLFLIHQCTPLSLGGMCRLWLLPFVMG